MLRTPKARWIAVVLAALLTATPAVPAFGAVEDSTASTSLFDWLKLAVDWQALSRVTSANEVTPEEAGEAGQPAPLPGIESSQVQGGESSGDAAPRWDPDG
jgi:hypothetical protein